MVSFKIFSLLASHAPITAYFHFHMVYPKWHIGLLGLTEPFWTYDGFLNHTQGFHPEQLGLQRIRRVDSEGTPIDTDKEGNVIAYWRATKTTDGQWVGTDAFRGRVSVAYILNYHLMLRVNGMRYGEDPNFTQMAAAMKDRENPAAKKSKQRKGKGKNAVKDAYDEAEELTPKFPSPDKLILIKKNKEGLKRQYIAADRLRGVLPSQTTGPAAASTITASAVELQISHPPSLSKINQASSSQKSTPLYSLSDTEHVDSFQRPRAQALGLGGDDDSTSDNDGKASSESDWSDLVTSSPGESSWEGYDSGHFLNDSPVPDVTDISEEASYKAAHKTWGTQFRSKVWNAGLKSFFLTTAEGACATPNTFFATVKDDLDDPQNWASSCLYRINQQNLIFLFLGKSQSYNFAPALH